MLVIPFQQRMGTGSATRFNAPFVFSGAILLRLGLLFYGLLQDAYSPMKYTDIDYYVFTDAARFLSHGQTPYMRDTYRYTPLLAWLLLPSTWYPWSFSFGKVLFALGDILAGWLIVRVLRVSYGMPEERALKCASIWLLNPMVATISTRGSSEGLLGVMVVALLWAVTRRKIILAGVILGLAVHFKIYPFIYGISIMWWLDETNFKLPARRDPEDRGVLMKKITSFLHPARVTFAVTSLATFFALSCTMYLIYGWPLIQHTYLHHLTRIDHRHNFSVYNTLLHLKSASPSTSNLHFESLAFLPQLFLSAFAIPLVLAKEDLASTMLAQTFAFVTFNKVCTSQYFLWYMIFLPFYLPKSSLMSQPRRGIFAAALWVLSQVVWLQQGYQLEFLGTSTFVPGLWFGGILFFLTNVWILGIIIVDVGRMDDIAVQGQHSKIS